jgi:hypothetical protein
MKTVSKITTLFSLLLLISCGPQKAPSGLPLDEKGREDFSAFIDKFYNDIEFQLSRVEFPVLTKPTEDGRPGLIEEENWRVMKPVNKANADYEVKLYEISEDLIEQRIIVKRAFIIELKYNLNPVDKQWYLTYYSGIGGQSYVGNKDSNDTNNKPSSNKIMKDSTGTIQIQIDTTLQ